MTLKTIKFTAICIDAGTQFREELDQDKVAEYAEHMADGDVFPPMRVVFDGTRYILWDGFTRYFAMHRSLPKMVEVDYKPGTLDEAKLLAAGANHDHGQPRSIQTKTNQVKEALENIISKYWSDREIAKLCHVSHTFVATVRSPEAKEQKEKNKAKSAAKIAKVESTPPDSKLTNAETPEIPSGKREDNGPSADEIAASEALDKQQRELIDSLIESDDKFATLMEANKKLAAENVALKLRMSGMMNEKNAAVKHAKTVQAKLDKLSKK